MTPKKEAETKPEAEKPVEPPKDVAELLGCIQRKLKAPKSQHNKHGNFYYRNCEDILEALKPLLPKGAYVTVQDAIHMVGDRFYVEATASIHYLGGVVQNKAYAREALEQKGMQQSQLTGATSSYARKYALNGLFLIDDTKDADSDNKDKPNEKAAFNMAYDAESNEESYNQVLKTIAGFTTVKAMEDWWSEKKGQLNKLPKPLYDDVLEAATRQKTDILSKQSNGAHF
jgi:ERF superfamily